MPQSENEKKATVANYYLKINKTASVVTDKRTIALLWAAIYKKEKLHEIRREDVINILDKKLATYRTIEGETASVSVSGLISFYNSLPLKQYLEDTADINRYVRQIAVNEYIKKDAQEMGLLNDPEFRLNKKNFEDNIVYQKYIEDNLGVNRSVNDSDLMKVYRSIKDMITHPTNIVYSVYTFSNAANAYKALSLVRMRPGDTTVNLNSLSQHRHIRFDKNQSQLPDTLKKMIYRVRPGQPSPPVETNGYFTVLIVESATGSEPFTANEIRPYLTALAKEKKERDYNNRKAGELRGSLKVKNNINIKHLTDDSALTTFNKR